MARWICMAVVVSVAITGCDNSTKSIATARPVNSKQSAGGTVEIAPLKAPEKSDPKAAEVVAAAVAAHTGGKPELLQKLKTARYGREGKVNLGGVGSDDQEWEVFVAWPDRFRVNVTMPQSRVTFVLAGKDAWRAAGGGPRITLPQQRNDDLRIDFTGDWLQLLFPLTEPETIVALAEEATVGGKPAVGVRVWHPGLSDAILYFDRETKLLVRLTFVGQEGGAQKIKDILILGSKEFAGVKLPERAVYKWANGTQFAEWTTIAVEPQEKLDPKIFEQP